MAKIGYARVSTKVQNDDSQVDELTAYGVDKTFTDKVSGKLAERPELDKALAYLREGDVLVITRLSRAMRSLKHMLALTEELKGRGVGLVVLKQSDRHDHADRAAGLPHPRRDRRVPARTHRGEHERGAGRRPRARSGRRA